MRPKAGDRLASCLHLADDLVKVDGVAGVDCDGHRAWVLMCPPCATAQHDRSEFDQDVRICPIPLTDSEADRVARIIDSCRDVRVRQ